MIWLLWIGVIASFLRQLFARQCCSMWLWIDKARVLTSSVFFFSTWSTLKSHHFWDLVEKYFQIIVALRSPLSLGEERLWKPGKSSVWSSVFGVCRVGDEKNLCVSIITRRGTLGWCFPNCQITQCFLGVFFAFCQGHVLFMSGCSKGVAIFGCWKISNLRKKPSNFHDIQFFSSELHGWWLSAVGCHVFRWLMP